jgi:hypothetical protein
MKCRASTFFEVSFAVSVQGVAICPSGMMVEAPSVTVSPMNLSPDSDSVISCSCISQSGSIWTVCRLQRQPIVQGSTQRAYFEMIVNPRIIYILRTIDYRTSGERHGTLVCEWMRTDDSGLEGDREREAWIRSNAVR